MVTGDEADTYQPVKSADRTLDALEALAALPGPIGLAQLSRQLGIPKSSLHGILRTLHRRGWVRADPTGLRFSIGLRAMQVGATFVETDGGLSRAQTTLDWLAEKSGETVQLARLDGADVVYLAKRGSRHPLQLISTVGSRLPAHATALGKAMLSHKSPAEVIACLPHPLPPLTNQTITEPEALLDDLATVRSRGYAVDHEEAAEGLRCLAVAVRTGYDFPDAISFSVPLFRLSADVEAQLIKFLFEGRDRIEAGLSPFA